MSILQFPLQQLLWRREAESQVEKPCLEMGVRIVVVLAGTVAAVASVTGLFGGSLAASA